MCTACAAVYKSAVLCLTVLVNENVDACMLVKPPSELNKENLILQELRKHGPSSENKGTMMPFFRFYTQQ